MLFGGVLIFWVKRLDGVNMDGLLGFVDIVVIGLEFMIVLILVMRVISIL